MQFVEIGEKSNYLLGLVVWTNTYRYMYYLLYKAHTRQIERTLMTDKEKIELKKKQWDLAMDGDVRMLIWLGKQYLGQKETPDFIKDDLCEGFDLQEIKSVEFKD